MRRDFNANSPCDCFRALCASFGAYRVAGSPALAAECAQLIADALDTISPDNIGAEDTARRMAAQFQTLATNLRSAQA